MTPFEEVAAYVAGTLDVAAADALEERLFAEPALLEGAAFVFELADALRDLAAFGPIVPVVTPAQLRELSTRSRILECRARDNVAFAVITPDVDHVAARLPVDLVDTSRVDVAFATMDGHTYFVACEAPFDSASGELIVLCRSHVAKRAGRIRIFITDERDQRRAEFVLDSV